MDIELSGKINLFFENYNEIKKALRWDGRKLNHIEALIYSKNDREFNIEKIKEIRKYTKKNKKIKKIFSRKILRLFSIILSEFNDYKMILDRTVEFYKRLIESDFIKGDKTAYIAFVIAKGVDEDNINEVMDKLLEVKASLKGEELLSYVNLAYIDEDINNITKEMELVREKIQEVGLNLDLYIQDLSTVLILEKGNITNKLEKLLDFTCNIKSELFQVPNEAFSLISLSLLFANDAELFSKELSYVYKTLGESKVFGWFTKNESKMLISIGLLLNKYIEEYKAELLDIDMQINEGINLEIILEEYMIYYYILRKY